MTVSNYLGNIVFMTKIDQFLGLWELLPDQSNYDLGSPPSSGTYEIIANGQELTFKMAWTDAQGENHELAYSEICDGEYHPYPNADIADEIRLSLLSDTVLESVAKKNGAVILSAQRVLLSDSEMRVIMSGPLPDSGSYQNISHYQKR